MTTLVHYIYVGTQVPEQSNARRFAWSSPRHRVGNAVHTILWCNKELLEPFAALKRQSPFESPIQEIRLVEPLIEAFPGESSKWLKEAADLLFRCRCFSALKDMLSLAIVYAFGGYFLDASTYLVGFEPTTTDKDAQLRTFVAQFRSGHAATSQTSNAGFRPYALGPRFPVLRAVQSTDPGQQQGQEIHTLGLNSSRPGLKLITPWLEYWALYANKEDRIVQKMLEIYLKNVLVKMSIPLQLNGWSLVDILTRGEEKGLGADQARDLRNQTIGQLICSAVKDGLLECWPGLATATDGEDVRGNAFGAMTWDAFLYRRHAEPYTKKSGMSLPHSRWLRAYMPELGLMKRYEGAWR
ncbi:hypothetical protein LY474_19260 [Myxococcus stipitatus]|uniref:hypothetical protein n=1 Tax=Myxococcus stipitatus TaxID=83455 RepID=UPI001F3C0470|nr:hypothetical protein [Myxococcus stipitatus]MCE9669941.1 hypothetical protein [Myxococcus stipitatus]